jgi:membrane fusion protein, multidrug efflux system
MLQEWDMMITATRDTTMNAEIMPDDNGAQGQGRMLSPALLLSLTILSLSSLGLWGCGAGAQAEGSTDEGAYPRVINVEVTSVETMPFTENIRLTGTVQARKDVTISAEESGVVREILVEKGSRVRMGEPIVRLDAALLQAQLEQARALSELARETWERRKRLYEEDQVGSELSYLEARYGAEQAAANLKLLQERVERTMIRAPIDGILDSREIEVGTMVGVGTPVARIVDTDQVKITAGVPERYAGDVMVGSPVVVGFGPTGEGPFEGRISYVGAVVNTRNRTFPIELTLPNPGRVIKPEMVAEVSVVRRTLDEATLVPQESLVRVEGGFVVFVVEGEGPTAVARAREVELGPAQENLVVIREGLEPGERLVVVGQQTVADGDRVNVVAQR